MEHFTPFGSLVGGAMIGVAASLLLLGNGRIAGISGVVRGLLRPAAGDTAWRVLFVAGLALGGLTLRLIEPRLVQADLHRSAWVVAIAGLLVGFGTALGNGCTSGHGVCGISRGSVRSVVATVTFMATGILTVWLVRHAFGGGV
jgi:uncharacterized membrane protein YedE/YeeE